MRTALKLRHDSCFWQPLQLCLFETHCICSIIAALGSPLVSFSSLLVIYSRILALPLAVFVEFGLFYLRCIWPFIEQHQDDNLTRANPLVKLVTMPGK